MRKKGSWPRLAGLGRGQRSSLQHLRGRLKAAQDCHWCRVVPALHELPTRASLYHLHTDRQTLTYTHTDTERHTRTCLWFNCPLLWHMVRYKYWLLTVYKHAYKHVCHFVTNTHSDTHTHYVHHCATNMNTVDPFRPYRQDNETWVISLEPDSQTLS